MTQMKFEHGQLIYRNAFKSQEDVSDWILEGQPKISSTNDKIVLENELDPDIHGNAANWVLWCPETFPDKIIVEWEFYPLYEPGLCMLFFATAGKEGQDIFDETLPERSGDYPHYHSGAINTLHLSYFRRKFPSERAFRTCNLRKSYGAHMVAQAGDPLPPVADSQPPYRMRLVKFEGIIQFKINDLLILEWADDGKTYGPVLEGGHIGFRQMAPMKAAYANFNVYQAIRIK